MVVLKWCNIDANPVVHALDYLVVLQQAFAFANNVAQTFLRMYAHIVHLSLIMELKAVDIRNPGVLSSRCCPSDP